jgi:hypothetical protein
MVGGFSGGPRVRSKTFDIEEGGPSSFSVLWLDSRRIRECVAEYRRRRLDLLAVNPHRGFKGRSLDFLGDFPDLSGLMITGPKEPFDLEPLSALSELKTLIVTAPTRQLRLGQFRKLSEFHGTWHPSLELDRTRLKTLHLWQYRPPTCDLSTFPGPTSLRVLGFHQGNLRSLRGVERLSRLRHLTLSNLNQLESVAELASLRELEELNCHTCRKLGDVSELKTLPRLRSLRLNNCGTLPSLRFLDQGFRRLEEFRFVGTNVEDGDLRPLLRLSDVGFLKKRHFSHTPEQLDALLRPRGGRAVVR